MRVAVCVMGVIFQEGEGSGDVRHLPAPERPPVVIVVFAGDVRPGTGL